MSVMSGDRPTIAESLITARLLMMQSKRLLLAGIERRLLRAGREQLHGRAERLRAETENAHESYCSSVLRWGSPDGREYWSAAYDRLVVTADRLSKKLREASSEMAPEDRYAAAAEVEVLETMAEDWRASLRGGFAPIA